MGGKPMPTLNPGQEMDIMNTKTVTITLKVDTPTSKNVKAYGVVTDNGYEMPFTVDNSGGGMFKRLTLRNNNVHWVRLHAKSTASVEVTLSA
jgi:hypothetical protein